jgi:ubiquinone/menaquinone biosynthesis C-methylase UbiE
MNPPLKDSSAIDAATPVALEMGHRLFQSHMFAPTDEGQVDYLLERLQPERYTHIVDMGCGVGEVARLMSLRRPDLYFTLVNFSEAQLLHCPHGKRIRHLCADAHRTGLNAGHADVVMFTTALVQMDMQQALHEAARLLHIGGVLFISEMVRFDGDNTEWEPLLGGRVPYPGELLDAIRTAGFADATAWSPTGDDSRFRKLLGDGAYLLNGVAPIIVRAVKL